MKRMTTKPTKNPAAVALGKLAAGKPKNYSAEELKRRTERLKAARRHQEGAPENLKELA